MVEKTLVLVVFVLIFALILQRKIPIHFLSLGGAAILVAAGLVPIETALGESVSWDVLAIYFGYGMLAAALQASNLPKAIADWILPRIKKEKYALLFLCSLAAFLSSFMANPVVVLMLAPFAIEVAERLKASLFLYLVGLSVASNAVTTVSMVADPPSLILALETGMTFLDFYWFQGRPGLGTLSIVGVVVALATLLFQFRGLNKSVALTEKAVRVSPVSRMLMLGGLLAAAAGLALNALGSNQAALGLLLAAGLAVVAVDRFFEARRGSDDDPYVSLSLGPSALFLLSVIALSVAPNAAAPGPLGIMKYHGWVGLLLGLAALLMLSSKWKSALVEYDWKSILFLIGIFVVIAAVDRVGLLRDFADRLIGLGLKDPLAMFLIITWLSVLLSSFIDNVPYTVLMIPVCGYLAKTLEVNPFFFYYGMLVGTGLGGNITPVGATANVLACGILEKRGYRIDLKQYMLISVPFSGIAVLSVQLLLQLFWWS